MSFKRNKNKKTGYISIYARRKDYHKVVKSKLKSIGRFICSNSDIQIKVFVDTAPIMEKPLAELSDMGWIGKHTNLVSKQFGSWLFLGIILTNYNFNSIINEKKIIVELVKHVSKHVPLMPLLILIN